LTIAELSAAYPQPQKLEFWLVNKRLAAHEFTGARITIREAEIEEGPMKTVWIYVDTNKQVGDVDHLKVFATPEVADEWFKGTTLKASPLDTRS
jgi:hypothetical protein